jgi:hypothetical protein
MTEHNAVVKVKVIVQRISPDEEEKPLGEPEEASILLEEKYLDRIEDAEVLRLVQESYGTLFVDLIDYTLPPNYSTKTR